MGFSVLPILEYFLSQVRKVCIYFLWPFIFLFFLWDPYNVNVSAFNIVSEVSETFLILFSLFCSVAVTSMTLFLLYSFF